MSGNITETNVPNRADFDLAMLESFPQYDLEMETPWTDGVQRFQGVALNELLLAVGAQGSTLRAMALNDYQATINLDELRDVQVLLAVKLNGRHMRVRDKGPLWIVYPTDSFSAADLPRHQSNMVWQLRSLEIR
ncbi:molybdopterin-dependent oxidoreductase [Marinobacterium ramblicola]|uniref:molybdopterin-dependent oxidoreductase n=1 Tax=Marinobacterium ramblicola TaxID=2849041 RepID=UPI001C2D96CC